MSYDDIQNLRITSCKTLFVQYILSGQYVDCAWGLWSVLDIEYTISNVSVIMIF